MFEASGHLGTVGADALASEGSEAPGMVGMCTALVAEVEPSELDDRGLVDELASLERLSRAASAVMARLTAELHTRRRDRDATTGVPAARRGCGVGHEVALARRESPYAGREHVTLARALVDDMPETLAALERGDISERQALIMVRETADLARDQRRAVDASLGGRLRGLGDKEILRLARRMAYDLDAPGCEERVRRARERRRVTCRRTGDGMARVSGDIRAEDAVAVIESLREHADACRAAGDDRTRDQAMADAFADRLNGSPFSDGRTVEVQVVMSAEMLLGADDTTPAHVPGYGPIPAGIIRDLLVDPETSVFVRRLYAHPEFGTLVAMDSARERSPDSFDACCSPATVACAALPAATHPSGTATTSGGGARTVAPASTTARDSVRRATTPARRPAGATGSSAAGPTRTSSRSPRRPVTPTGPRRRPCPSRPTGQGPRWSSAGPPMRSTCPPSS